VRVVLLLDQSFEVAAHLHSVWSYGPDQGDGFLMCLAAGALSQRGAAGGVSSSDPAVHTGERTRTVREAQSFATGAEVVGLMMATGSV
jgi:hypothetical protein